MRSLRVEPTSRGPRRGVRDRQGGRDGDRAAGAGLQRGAHQAGVRRRHPSAAPTTGTEAPTTRLERQLRGAAVGAGAVLGQGPRDRQQDDQRPHGDRRTRSRRSGGPFAKRRCLLPADGYYEWYPTEQRTKAGKPVKQPFFIRPADGSVLAMAGLYEIWRDPTRDDDDPQRFRWTCTVLTTTGRGRRRPHPRPDAAAASSRERYGGLARPDQRRPRRPARPCWCRPPRPAARPTRSRTPGQQRPQQRPGAARAARRPEEGP